MSSENIIKIKEKARSAVSFDFKNLCFSPQSQDSYRVRATSCSEGVTLWVESVECKEQWQVTVRTISDFGPSGIPDDVVYALLEKALGLVESGLGSADDPKIDLRTSDKGVLLTLQLVLGGVWRPEFVFTLLPVALEKVDLLEARLRDAYDEIKALRAGNTPAYLSISSKTICPHNEIVQWDGDGPIVSPSYFKFSEDFKQVTILKGGVYQISLRLLGRSNGHGTSTALQVNAIDVATCYQTGGNICDYTAQIHEIVKLELNDVLQINCGFNGSIYTQQTGKVAEIVAPSSPVLADSTTAVFSDPPHY
eukprot:gene8704-10301_t